VFKLDYQCNDVERWGSLLEIIRAWGLHLMIGLVFPESLG
jgi:hypothetical protein